MNPHLKGLLITALGVLLVVPDSLFVRLIEAEPLVIAFWRGVTSGTLILIAVLAANGRLGGFRQTLSAGRPIALFIVMIGSTTATFVLAVSNTSVANVVFIFASIPMFAAIFSRVFLGERISSRIIWTMLVIAVVTSWRVRCRQVAGLLRNPDTDDEVWDEWLRYAP